MYHHVNIVEKLYLIICDSIESKCGNQNSAHLCSIIKNLNPLRPKLLLEQEIAKK